MSRSAAADARRPGRHTGQAPGPGGSARDLPVAGALAGGRSARQVRRAFRDLAAVPLLVVLGFAVLAAVSIVADQTNAVGVLDSLRSALGHVVGAQAANTALSTIAGGLVTVTSITFSVLLLAVQQTASSLSPVVFDQFLRRRSNQAFLGFFVGLALFAYVVMAAVGNKTPPIVGATVATLLTVAALMILLLLVYSTVNQMRPSNVLRVIHDRALQARAGEAELIRRTRRASRSEHDVAARYVSHATGYVTGFAVRDLEQLVAGQDGVEVELCVTIGDHVSYGDLLAVVRDGDTRRAERVARALGRLLQLSDTRDLGSDATTGVDEIGNIAWTSTSTAKHNPEIGREGLFALRDLAARWMLDDPADTAADASTGAGALPVVYRDNDLDRVLSWIYSMLLAAHESQQHLIAVAVLDTYGALLQLAPDDLRARLRSDVRTGYGIAQQLPVSPELRTAWQRILAEAGTGGTDVRNAPVRLGDAPA